MSKNSRFFSILAIRNCFSFPFEVRYIESLLYDQLFLSDFNAGVEDSSVRNFCSSFNLTSMINKPTCFKKPDKPSCIILILTNCPRSFQNSCVIETGWPGFHKLVVQLWRQLTRNYNQKLLPITATNISTMILLEKLCYK